MQDTGIRGSRNFRQWGVQAQLTERQMSVCVLVCVIHCTSGLANLLIAILVEKCQISREKFDYFQLFSSFIEKDYTRSGFLLFSPK